MKDIQKTYKLTTMGKLMQQIVTYFWTDAIDLKRGPDAVLTDLLAKSLPAGVTLEQLMSEVATIPEFIRTGIERQARIESMLEYLTAEIAAAKLRKDEHGNNRDGDNGNNIRSIKSA